MSGIYNAVDRDLNQEPAKLGASINSIVTTIATEAGDGAKLPSLNGIVNLVEYSDMTGTYREAQASGIVGWERLELTTRSTDTLTVVRGFGADSTARSFPAGSYILNVISVKHYDRQNEHIRAGLNPFTTEVKR